MSFKKIKATAKKNDYEFIHVKKTTSTMSNVRNFLDNKNKNCIIISDQQTNGRGQRGKNWISPKGNIYCSISFKNFLDIKEHFLFSILIAVSIKMSLNKFTSENIKFKWPNDIFFKNKKLGGIVAENYNNASSNFMILGFGINVISSPDIKKYPTTYLDSFCKIKDISIFLSIFFEILFINLDLLKNNNFNKIITQFKKSLLFYNKKITMNTKKNNIIQGIFRGINKDGSLILENNNKKINLYNGNIIL